MMDSGRLFRALVMVITLLVCIWALNRLEAHRVSVPVVSPVDTTRAEKPEPQVEASSLEPAVPVETLPLVAMDNTCFYTADKDLSSCTATLSGGPAREYHLATTKATPTLYIGVVPRSEWFDASFALFNRQHECVIGRDDHSAGIPERAVVSNLKPGEYTLVVGGYSDDCGPYELTVGSDAPEIAQVMDTEVFDGRNGHVVRWESFAEIGVQHYVLYRTQGDFRQCVAVLRAHGSPAGFAKYRVMDRLAPVDSMYEIEAVAQDGRKELISIAV